VRLGMRSGSNKLRLQGRERKALWKGFPSDQPGAAGCASSRLGKPHQISLNSRFSRVADVGLPSLIFSLRELSTCSISRRLRGAVARRYTSLAIGA